MSVTVSVKSTPTPFFLIIFRVADAGVPADAIKSKQEGNLEENLVYFTLFTFDVDNG